MNNKEKIQEIIAEINSCYKKVEESHRKFYRDRFLGIDDLGGHTALGYKYDKDFVKAEFPGFSAQWVINERTCGRIEQVLEIPIGSYSLSDLFPLRQFRVRKPSASTNGTRGTCGSHRNLEGEKKLKEAWAIACELAAPNQPDASHIETAVAQMSEKGEAKMTLVPAKRQAKYSISKGEIEKELRHYKGRCEKLEDENMKLKEELQKVRLQLRRIA